MNDLALKELKPPRSKVPPLKRDEIAPLHESLGPDWHVLEDHHLEKEFATLNFAQALQFVNKIGELAERVDHHPDICLGWGYVRIKIWTHFIGGLHEADFIFAAKVDQLAE